MNLSRAVVASLALAVMPVLAHADDMSYRYIQIGYISTDLPNISDPIISVDSSADGFATRGSLGFAKNFFLFTEYNNQEFDITDTETSESVNIGIDQVTVGLGGHYAVSENLDVVGRLGWSQLSFDGELSGGGGAEADEDGYLAGAGLRGRIGDNFELEGGVVYQDFGGGSSDTGAEVLARYYFNKRWAIAAEYQDIGQLSSYIIGVRASF